MLFSMSYYSRVNSKPQTLPHFQKPVRRMVNVSESHMGFLWRTFFPLCVCLCYQCSLHVCSYSQVICMYACSHVQHSMCSMHVNTCTLWCAQCDDRPHGCCVVIVSFCLHTLWSFSINYHGLDLNVFKSVLTCVCVCRCTRFFKILL